MSRGLEFAYGLMVVLAELRAEVEVEIVRLKVVQARCRHPHTYQRSVMGREIETRCSGCGKEV